MRMRKRVWGWTGAAVGVLLLVLLALPALVDFDLLKRPIERLASAHAGRTISIAGKLRAHLWSWTPGFTLTGLTVGGPPWDPGHPVLQTKELQLQVKFLPLLRGRVILERLQLTAPVIYLHREADGRANWTFENKAPSTEPTGPPSRLPLVRNFVVDAGQLTLVDEVLHLDVQAAVQAHEQATRSDPHAFRLQGKGSVNRQPLTIELSGGPLVTLEPDRPYPFGLRIKAGEVQIDSDGVLHKPFDLGRIGFTIRASGSDLADFYYLTQLAFPNTPPFRLQAAIERDGAQITVDPLSGQIGGSDLHGRLNVDISHKRPTVSGDLASNQLRLKDLAASLGTRASNDTPHPLTLGDTQRPPAPQQQTAQHAPPATVAASARLFPDARLQVERVRAMNADVRFTATAIDAGTVPLKQVALRIRLDDGVLSLDPFEFTLPEGVLHGTLRLDARNRTPQTQLDLRVRHIELAQFHGQATAANAPLAGDVEARIVLSGAGDSVHDFVANADGRVTFILPHGEIRSALAELTGIDVVEGLGLLLSKGKHDDIRCGVAQFAVHDGTMQAQNLLIDTSNVLITGSGDIKLGPEQLELAIKGQPKKLRLTRLKTPIEIRGHLLKPAIHLDLGQTVKQGAIAAALGALLTPLAAVIAFVDPGLAKNANCASLLAGATQSPPAPRL